MSSPPYEIKNGEIIFHDDFNKSLDPHLDYFVATIKNNEFIFHDRYNSQLSKTTAKKIIKSKCNIFW
jgi:hypothetical protein